jgi:hypothetical protein
MLFGRMYPGTAAGLGAIRGLTFYGRNDMVEAVSWDRPFAEPIELPKGKKLVTLRDAALYITKLPKVEHDAEEWQAAMAALLLVAEHDGPTMFARIGVMRALNRHVERVFDPLRKDIERPLLAQSGQSIGVERK